MVCWLLRALWFRLVVVVRVLLLLLLVWIFVGLAAVGFVLAVYCGLWSLFG